MTETAAKLREALLVTRAGGMSLYGAIRLGFPSGDNSGPWCLDHIAKELAAVMPPPVVDAKPAPKTLVEVFKEEKAADLPPPPKPAPKKKTTRKKVIRKRY